jgi:hypothetical protein
MNAHTGLPHARAMANRQWHDWHSAEAAQLVVSTARKHESRCKHVERSCMSFQCAPCVLGFSSLSRLYATKGPCLQCEFCDWMSMRKSWKSQIGRSPDLGFGVCRFSERTKTFTTMMVQVVPACAWTSSRYSSSSWLSSSHKQRDSPAGSPKRWAPPCPHMTAVADFILKDRLWPLSMECLFQADRCQRLSGFIIDFW